MHPKAGIPSTSEAPGATSNGRQACSREFPHQQGTVQPLANENQLGAGLFSHPGRPRHDFKQGLHALHKKTPGVPRNGHHALDAQIFC